MIPICQGCFKPADQIDEYVEAAGQEGKTPDHYVMTDEGTYNPENGHFLCTECYIKAGMPASPPGSRYGWKCP